MSKSSASSADDAASTAVDNNSVPGPNVSAAPKPLVLRPKRPAESIEDTPQRLFLRGNEAAEPQSNALAELCSPPTFVDTQKQGDHTLPQAAAVESAHECEMRMSSAHSEGWDVEQE